MSLLKGKRVAVLGERDGIAGPVIGKCLEETGAEVVFTATECFV